MKVQVRFPAAMMRRIEELFEAAEPREQGVFVLAGQARTIDDLTLCARRLLEPPDDGWRLQEPGRLAPSLEWLSAVLDEADASGDVLVMMHSHPGPWAIAEFSPADEWMHAGLVPEVQKILGNRPFCSLVWADGVVAGSAWVECGVRDGVDHVWETGHRLVDKTSERKAAPESATDARQILLWGEAGQTVLGQLRVGIVGAGGTGSAVAEQLCRIGVGELLLVDHDLLEATNVTRVYGSTLADVGHPKVEVVAAHVRRIRGTHVDVLVAHVESREATERLRGCDLLFGCTDNVGSRTVLNAVAVQYLIPLIDIGCGIGNREGTTDGITSELRVVRPDGPCLRCMGTFTSERVWDEAQDPEARVQLAQEGYVRGLREEPSVVHVTSATASLGVQACLDMVVGLCARDRDRVVMDLHHEDFLNMDHDTRDCGACRPLRGVGDARQIYF